ncbi:MAG: DMT family transporter [Alphaproteobacteria bacterium]|nr:DMT family transporter [Alphaproteobacteria bacterium]MBT5827274.1 DMT family transporter [Alphaproteobacteria bacterium]
MLSKKSEGIMWAIISSFWISIMLCLVRYISEYYNAYIIVFWRLFFSLLLMLPWLIRSGFHVLKTSKLKLFFFRAVIGIIAMLIWFYALVRLPLPQATSLSFTGPIFTTIAAIIFLKERPGIYRISAILVGFTGVLIIVRPGFIDFNLATILVLISTSLWAIAAIIIKKLSATEQPKLITFYMASMMMPIALIFAVFNWQIIELNHVIWLLLIGLTSNFAHNALSKSLSLADVTAIMPYDFIRLVFVGIFAYILFNDQTNIYDILGSLVIITSNIYISYRENKLKKLDLAKVKKIKSLISN